MLISLKRIHAIGPYSDLFKEFRSLQGRLCAQKLMLIVRLVSGLQSLRVDRRARKKVELLLCIHRSNARTWKKHTCTIIIYLIPTPTPLPRYLTAFARLSLPFGKVNFLFHLSLAVLPTKCTKIDFLSRNPVVGKKELKTSKYKSVSQFYHKRIRPVPLL